MSKQEIHREVEQSGVTIMDYLARYLQAQEALVPILKPAVVARALGRSYETAVGRIANLSFSPEEFLEVLAAYKDTLPDGMHETLSRIAGEEYEAVEERVTERVKELPFSLKEFSRAAGMNYNKVINVTQGREKWTLPYLEKIGAFLEALSILHYL